MWLKHLIRLQEAEHVIVRVSLYMNWFVIFFETFGNFSKSQPQTRILFRVSLWTLLQFLIQNMKNIDILLIQSVFKRNPYQQHPKVCMKSQQGASRLKRPWTLRVPPKPQTPNQQSRGRHVAFLPLKPFPQNDIPSKPSSTTSFLLLSSTLALK